MRCGLLLIERIAMRAGDSGHGQAAFDWAAGRYDRMKSRTRSSVFGHTRRPLLSCLTKGLSFSASRPNCHGDMPCAWQKASMS